jgi:hypothetical protein
MGGVGVMVEEVAEAAHQAGGGRSGVVAAEDGGEARICSECGTDAVACLSVELHIGIHKQQDLPTGLGGTKIPGGSRPLTVVRLQQGGSAGEQPVRRLRGAPVKDDERMLPAHTVQTWAPSRSWA